MRKIGISGGTFDPIHNGHLILTEMVREQYDLERVVFIPSGTPPHKPISGVTDAEHRFRMVECAVSTNPYFTASHIEIDRKGYTYTIDTLKHLKQIYGDETKLFFITGADVIWDLTAWRRFDEIFGMCEFVTALRPGYKKEVFEKEIEYLRDKYSARIHLAEIPLIQISSTAIREKVRNNNSIKYLVPECVESYIIENGLYK